MNDLLHNSLFNGAIALLLTLIWLPVGVGWAALVGVCSLIFLMLLDKAAGLY